jgi:protein-tyrosine phosphatase
MSDRIGVLFVCLGNICRSPLAEAVFHGVVADAGLSERFDIDSAGTSGYHAGEGADARTQAVARRRGIDIDHVARQIHASDFERFDYIVVMDRENLHKVERLRDRVAPHAAVRLLRAYDPHADEEQEVPDPYFGGEAGFALVQEMIERSCEALLATIRAERLL